MKVEIEVTQEDIAWGIPDDIHSCPIAKAVARTLGIDPDDVTVEAFAVAIEAESPLGFGEGRYSLPDIAEDFIEAFDDSEPVAPFRFILDNGG